MRTEMTPITGREVTSTEGPRRALAQFYEAFNSRDLEKVARNWAQADDVVMDNPVGGIKRGWPEIRSVYERIFTAEADVQVEFYDYSTHQAGAFFYVVGRERGTFRKDGESIPLAIRTTRIFRFIEGEWRQVHHHGSFEDPELLARYQNALGLRREVA